MGGYRTFGKAWLVGRWSGQGCEETPVRLGKVWLPTLAKDAVGTQDGRVVEPLRARDVWLGDVSRHIGLLWYTMVSLHEPLDFWVSRFKVHPAWSSQDVLVHPTAVTCPNGTRSEVLWREASSTTENYLD